MAEDLYTHLMDGPTAESGPDPFDRHVLAAAIASGCLPPHRALTESLALSPCDLARLIATVFPHAGALLDWQPPWPGPRDDEPEEPALRALLYDNRTPGGDPDLARWLARIIARRSLGDRHLWEDLGLGARADLSRLMARHFGPLSERNQGMRWKKFFYRSLCEQEGVLLCKAPNCEVCEDYALCFAPEEAIAGAGVLFGPARTPAGGALAGDGAR
ncbi:nitrogen fixation protein NifQ [Roseospira goensis]|uniref:Nitrogen fixation protein NifQ n=1 Tax=Roseospira goensis TaxID=391922 RepID=A0A7W6S0X1_9PROT|nr:nitrogen fixation protein NifQ [Roseospira goensis]MBB4286866.1 nitrogen fixation protein NifQ [Roseospira goensis]